MDEHYGIAGLLSDESSMKWWDISVGQALWDSGIAQ